MPMPLVDPLKLADLRALLLNHGVPLEKWGTGAAKTIEQLYLELLRCEAWLDEDGCVFRRMVDVAAVNVFYTLDGVTMILREAEQRFADGRVRTRNLLTSLGEKVLEREDPVSSVRRALREELGIEAQVDVRPMGERVIFPDLSYDFPGLPTRCYMYCFDVTLDEGSFKREGYEERQKDKTTVFRWVPVS